MKTYARSRSPIMTRLMKWLAVTAAILVLLAVGSFIFVNQRLASFIEQQLATHVEGYQFTVGEASLSPTLALDIRRLTILQTAHPDPPVAEIPRWHFSIQWRNIFSGVIVSDYLIDHPTFHITLPQAKKEVLDEVAAVQKRLARRCLFLLPHQDK